MRDGLVLLVLLQTTLTHGKHRRVASSMPQTTNADPRRHCSSSEQQHNGTVDLCTKTTSHRELLCGFIAAVGAMCVSALFGQRGQHTRQRRRHTTRRPVEVVG